MQAGELPQQTLAAVASLADQLASLQSPGVWRHGLLTRMPAWSEAQAIKRIWGGLTAVQCATAPVCLCSAVKSGQALELQCLMEVCCVGGPTNPIANSAVQLLGALQAPQSNTYIVNLATSIVQLIGSVASGQSPTPATAALVVQILQVHVMPTVQKKRQSDSILAWQRQKSLNRGHDCRILLFASLSCC